MRNSRIEVVWSLWLVAIAIVALWPVPASADTVLVIVRRAQEAACTMGEMRVGDEFVGYTLERDERLGGLGRRDVARQIARSARPLVMRRKPLPLDAHEGGL
jgi:hypothetical protein